MAPQSRRRVTTTIIAIILISALAALAYRYWYQPTYDYVEVTDATVTGYLTNVAAPAGGRINQLYYNVGDTVHAGDTIATVEVIGAGAAPSAAGPSITRVLAQVTSPVDGRVAAQLVSTGDTVVTGQALATISNLSNLWVIANVDESRIGGVSANEGVDVNMSNLGVTLQGKVAQVGPGTTDFISPATNGVFGTSDTTRKIPVRISVDWAGTQPVPGMTADVRINLPQGTQPALGSLSLR
jgi:multidrug resistance efflux pump